MPTTMEQYVIARLQELERKNEELEAENQSLRLAREDQARQFWQLYNMLKDIATLSNYNGSNVISFSNVWEKYNKGAFDALCQLLGLHPVEQTTVGDTEEPKHED